MLKFFEHLINSCKEEPVSIPPLPIKVAHIKPEVLGLAVNRFSTEQLEYCRNNTLDPWVFYNSEQGLYSAVSTPPRFSRIVPTVVRDVVCLSHRKNSSPRSEGDIHIFSCSEKDGGCRPILNLRQINLFLKVLPF